MLWISRENEVKYSHWKIQLTLANTLSSISKDWIEGVVDQLTDRAEDNF